MNASRPPSSSKPQGLALLLNARRLRVTGIATLLLALPQWRAYDARLPQTQSPSGNRKRAQ